MVTSNRTDLDDAADDNAAESDAAENDALARLVDEVTHCWQTGCRFDAESLQRANPRLWERLQAILPTLRLLQHCSAAGPANQTTEPKASAPGFWSTDTAGASDSSPAISAGEPDSSVGPSVELTPLSDSDQLAAGGTEAPTGAAEDRLPLTASGSRTLGDFRLIREIGRGGMGVVYLAEQISQQRNVALKVLPPAALLDRRQVIRFLYESRAAMALDHPHIVPVFAVGSEDEVYYYAMKLIDGCSLAELSESAPLWAARQVGSEPGESDCWDVEVSYARSVARLGWAIADALQHAHDRGIIHRDIKPGNLLVDREGKPWVTDFGLARLPHHGSLTASGDWVGTLPYMSPEQLSTKAELIDERTDIYSLGITLYELLAGRRTLVVRDRFQALAQLLGSRPAALRRVRPGVPAPLATIIHKAMAPEISDRYTSAGELADDLRRFLRGEPILARPISTTRQLLRWAAKHHVYTGLLVGALLVFLTLSVIGWQTVALLNRKLAENELLRATAVQHRADLADQLLKEQRRDYVRSMQAASQALREQRYQLVAQLLSENDQPRPYAGQRDWAWHYLRNQVYAEIHELRGHEGFVTAVDISPDQRWVITGGKDQAICVWERATGKLHRRLSGHLAAINRLAFVPTDSSRFCSVSDDGQIGYWDVGHSLPVRLWAAHDGDVLSIAVSADGKLVASGGVDGLVRLWRLDDGQSLKSLSGHSDWVRDLVFHPREPRLYSASDDGTIRGWNYETGLLEQELTGHDGYVLCLDISADGERLVSGGKDRSVRLWSLKEGRQLSLLTGHIEWVRRVRFSADQAKLITTDQRSTTWEWNLSPLARTRRLLVHHAQPTRDMALAPDNKTLITVSDDGSARMWHAAPHTGPEVIEHALTAKMTDDRLPQGSSYFVDSFTPFAYGIDCANFTAHVLHLLPAPPRVVQLSPDQRELLVGQSAQLDLPTLSIVDLATQTTDQSLDSLISQANRGRRVGIYSAAWSPDGRFVAVATIDYRVFVLDRQLDRFVTSLPLAEPRLHRVSFSPDGKYLVASEQYGTAHLWNTHDWTVHGTVPMSGAFSFSPSGELFGVIGDEPIIYLLDANSLELKTKLVGHQNSIESLAFHPAGKILASLEFKQEIKLWDLLTGQEMLTLPTDKIGLSPWLPHGLQFSPDGETLYAIAHQKGVVGSIRIAAWTMRNSKTVAAIAEPKAAAQPE